MRSNRTYSYFRKLITNSSDLTGKEKDVLVARLKRKALVVIGKEYNVTEGRIRQVEKGAIRKLRGRFHQLALFRARARNSN